MRYRLNLIGCCLLFAFFQSCKDKPRDKRLDSFLANNARIVVDEAFQPIFDQELYVFKAENDSVNPTILYKPEAEAVNLLLNDSVRIAILSRNLTSEESSILKSRNLNPLVNRFAVDAIALIVNNTSNDTTITVSQIKDMLNGRIKSDKNIVFDNPNSGLVRYLKGLSGNSDFKQKNIYALSSNKEVIKYVSTHANAIGITDFSWLNDADKDYADAVDKVKIMSVMDDTKKNSNGQYFSPSAATLALAQYPLSRNLYIFNYTGNNGLGKALAVFMAGDVGQRIILRSGLLPDTIPDREITVIHKIKM